MGGIPSRGLEVGQIGQIWEILDLGWSDWSDLVQNGPESLDSSLSLLVEGSKRGPKGPKMGHFGVQNGLRSGVPGRRVLGLETVYLGSPGGPDGVQMGSDMGSRCGVEVRRYLIKPSRARVCGVSIRCGVSKMGHFGGPKWRVRTHRGEGSY